MVKIKSKQANVKVFKRNPEFEYVFDSEDTVLDVPEEHAVFILKNPNFYTEDKVPEKIWTREELEKLSMKELRKIGEPLGAFDTKKSELIEEILKKQKEVD